MKLLYLIFLVMIEYITLFCYLKSIYKYRGEFKLNPLTLMVFVSITVFVYEINTLIYTSFIFSLVICLLFSYCVTKEMNQKIFVIAVVYFVYSAMVEIITLNTLVLLINMPIEEIMNNSSIYLEIGIINKIIQALPLFFIRSRVKKPILSTLQQNRTIYAVTILFILFVIESIILTYSMLNGEVRNSLVLISLISIIVFILFFNLIINYNHLFVEKKYLEIEREYEKLQRDWINDIQCNQLELRKIKHDIKNVLSTTYSFLNNSEYEKASQFIESMLEKTNMIEISYWTGNVVVDSILSNKIALNEDIKFEVVASKITIEMNEVDTCILLVNLLDNAIEAQRDVNDKLICVSLFQNEFNFILKIENSYNKDKLIDFTQTSKKNKKTHGLGLQIVRGIVNKYEGYYKVDINDTIVSTIIIPIMESE